ncbi:winged helix-turn-helix domain-containing protein [Streptomyces griseoincarnatus]
MTGSVNEEGIGRRSAQVEEILRSRIADGTYPVGRLLPAQRELAPALGVSKTTLSGVLRRLAQDGLVENKQGSGSKVLRTLPAKPRTRPDGEMPVPHALGAWIERVFRQAEDVSLDVFTLTSETLHGHLQREAERILVEKRTPPRSLRVRMLVPSEDMPLPYPRAKDPSDPRIHERWQAMARRYAREMDQLVRKLSEAGIDARSEFRRVDLAPSFKLYIINGQHMLHGLYLPEETVITLDDEAETQVEAVDALGAFSRLHYINAESPNPGEAALFADYRAWFARAWDVLARADG